MKTIRFVDEVCKCPGGRDHAKQLLPAFAGLILPRIADGEIVEIDLDGGPGYAASFLDELFAGLVTEYGACPKRLREQLVFETEEEPHLEKEIRRFIEEAAQQAAE